jgi:hypothetical protein
VIRTQCEAPAKRRQAIHDQICMYVESLPNDRRNAVRVPAVADIEPARPSWSLL